MAIEDKIKESISKEPVGRLFVVLNGPFGQYGFMAAIMAAPADTFLKRVSQLIAEYLELTDTGLIKILSVEKGKDFKWEIQCMVYDEPGQDGDASCYGFTMEQSELY